MSYRVHLATMLKINTVVAFVGIIIEIVLSKL